MTAMVAFGDSDDSGSSPVSSPQEKVSRNKRKFRSDPPIGDTNKTPYSSPLERSSFEFSAEKSYNNSSHQNCDLCVFNRDHSGMVKPDFRLLSGPGPFEIGSSRPKEEAENSQDADWSDPTESQLKDIVLKNLDSIYKSAIKKIVACGYAEDVVSKAVLRAGLCYGYKDTLSNIVDNTLVFLRNGHVVNSSMEHFENLELLEKYVLAEMVCVLREVRHSYSIGDAMWCLLVCDMNLSQACAMDAELFSSFSNAVAPGSSSSNPTPSEHTTELKHCTLNLTNLDKPNHLFPGSDSSQFEMPTPTGNLNSPNLKTSLVLEGSNSEKGNINPQSENVDKPSSVHMELTQTIRRSCPSEEKPGGGRKAHSVAAKRESIHRQKSGLLEKYGKGVLRQGKLRNSGSLALDKKHKAVSESPVVDLKSGCLKLPKTPGVDVTQTSGDHIPLMSTVLATPAASNNLEDVSTQASLSPTDTELSLSQPSKPSTGSKSPSSELPALAQNYVGIPFDKALGKWVAGGKKDEIILKLAPRVKELQNQMQAWTDWANQKVMQAARRLSKDKTELKTLRLEKEETVRLKKEKQILEENTMKKLSEMENALRKASCQIDRANSAFERLELENARLGNQMEESKLRAAESAASCLEVMRREKNTMNKFQSWEKQKNFYQDELVTEKRKLAQLQQELEQENALQDQLEARRKREENAKEEYLTQANSLGTEREQIEASLKSNEEMIRLKAENDLQKYKDDIRKLEADISQLRLKKDSSKLAALRWGTDGRHDEDPKSNGLNQNFNIKDLQQDKMGSGNLKRERECVMCLTEEMSVVFLPCAHQVVCTKCNDLHEKQGMKDCPSCRTPIQRRICVRYARSS